MPIRNRPFPDRPEWPFDIIEGTTGDDTLIGTDDDDTIKGLRGNDSVEGRNGNDFILGLGEQDTLRGEAGDDTIYGGKDLDTIYGDKGDDEIWGNSPSDPQSRDYIEAGTGDDEINIGLNSTVYGGAGADTITAFDILGGSAGLLDGGPGQDVIQVIALGAFGREYEIIGGPGLDRLSGGMGKDTIDGDEGKDTLSGGEGADILNGGTEKDVIDGGIGDDIITGGPGGDRLTGDDTHDTYIYLSTADSNVFGTDFITQLKNSDSIDLSAIDANEILGGNQAFNLVSSFSGSAGELQLRLVGGNTFIEGDVNGDTVADLIIEIRGDRLNFSSFEF